MIEFNNEWDELLKDEFKKPYYLELRKKLIYEYRTQQIFPGMYDIFNALKYTSYSDIKAVIIGQDPYHEPGQAHGLAFSVQKGVKLPPSLQNISKELQADLGLPPLSCGCLTPWARQGVFLLNTVLTVEAGKANSHRDFGWQRFTDAVVASIAQLPQPVGFVLWGAQAQKKAAVCKTSPYPRLVLEAPHPSPLSAYRGFFGSRPFSQLNAFLRAHDEQEIDWTI